MYAEAKCELGTISQNDIDITINALRQRAGFDFDKYPTARLDMGNIPGRPSFGCRLQGEVGLYRFPRCCVKYVVKDASKWLRKIFVTGI